ncbi:alpha/beta fold hydrolase [Alteromonas facilis]|uniref:alpha/beta fold hydrolase n=1 Tax=Alteromonas facilis TaxID=2048004 RepID=UPI0013DD3B17|nr:alpha/beta hydrolase [Alteromonas facilis]
MTTNKLLVLSLSMFCFSISAKSLLVNQAELEYEIKGTGENITLFEAGAISGMAGWDSIWSRLPESVTAIRYSRRGEGRSTACTGDLTSSDYVEDAEELLNQLKIEKPIIYVSHSYGGKVAREFAVRNPEKVVAMLFIDPINPRDVDIIEQLDPIGGKESNEKLKFADIKMGKENNWCLINDIWDKTPSFGYGDIKNIPITLIAGVKKFENPTRLFDTDEARELWGNVQSEWVLKFPQGKAVMAEKSGHFVQDDEPDLVLSEIKKLIIRANEN